MEVLWPYLRAWIVANPWQAVALVAIALGVIALLYKSH
jgi:hypothetical protein